MIKWIVGLVTILCVGSIDAKELTMEDIFPNDRVLDIQITVSKQDWNKIRFQSRNFVDVLNKSRQFAPPEHPYTYVDASVSIDGVEFPKVGLRKKGFIGSQSVSRPSLKIKLNHVDKNGGIEGLNNLTLNNNQQDAAHVSQYLGYALFNKIGSPAPRCAYAKVTVNGKNLGIYSHVESMRKPILKRAFGHDNGTLYEGSVVDFYKDWENSFEHKRGDDKQGREKIKGLINVLSADEISEKTIGKFVDLDSFYRFWVTEGLLGFWDGYSGNNNNFFVYLNPETDKFHFMPWGADALFSNFDMKNMGRNTGAPISVKTQGLIAYRLYQLDEGKERYAKTMMDILENHWNEGKLSTELERISMMIQPHMIPPQLNIEVKEGRRRGETITFDEKVNEVHEFIRTRKGKVLEEISDGMPDWRRRPHPPIVMGPEGFDGKFMKQFIELPEDNLWGAARLGDLDGIKRYLSKGAKIDELSPDTNLSPLTWATMMGHAEAAELLIKLGANVNVRQEDGGTPLHVAVTLGRVELTKLLIDNGADVNAKNRGGAKPASGLYLPWGMLRIMIGMFDIGLKQEEVDAGRKVIAELLKTIPSTETQAVDKEVWDAVFVGDLKKVEKAIKDGLSVNASNPESGDPLIFTASLMGHTDIIAYLLEKNADVNVRKHDGNTPLHAAAFLGRAEAVKLLLKHGADANARNNDGGSAMDSATLDWGITEFILGLMQLDVDETEIKAERKKVVKLLSDHIKNNPSQSHDLWKAAADGDLSAIKKALENGADLSKLDQQYGIDPLGWAALNGETEAAKLLLEKGAKINNRHKDGSTALHAAAFLGRTETVKLLIEKGADINLKKDDGMTPLSVTKIDWGMTEFVAGLLKLKVDEEKVKAGRTEVAKLLSKQNK